MFWYLLLAHFLGDYPLQPNWMARNKTRPTVLLLHAGIHFLLMLAVLLPASSRYWPQLLALAGIHLLLDASKNWANVRFSNWRGGLYWIDQGLHALSVALVSAWIGWNSLNGVALFLPRDAVIAATGLLLVTYVYLISERVMETAAGENERQAEEASHPWIRLLIRGGLFLAVLLGWNRYEAALASLSLQSPYPANARGIRAFAQDVVITLVVAAAVISLM